MKPTCPACGTEVPSNRLHGIVLPTVYDGILIWRDERCGCQWPRFPAQDWRHEKAAVVIQLAEPLRAIP